MIIDKYDPIVPRGVPFDGVGLEYVFVEKRIYEELIVFRAIEDRYSGIQWNLLEQRFSNHNEKIYDVLRFEVMALHDRDWNELKAEWEGSNGRGRQEFDEAAHLRKRLSRTIRFVTEYWFEISSFYGFSSPR